MNYSLLQVANGVSVREGGEVVISESLLLSLHHQLEGSEVHQEGVVRHPWGKKDDQSTHVDA